MVTKNKKGKSGSAGLPIVHRHAAGLDVGSTFHVVALPEDADDEPLRTFKSFTGDLYRLADGRFHRDGRDVRGRPCQRSRREERSGPQDRRERRAVDPPAPCVRTAPRELPSSPHEQIVAPRAYLRHRERLVEYAASHIQHMQKSLLQMNVQLHHVVADITASPA
jgi:hypothetical protein